PAASTAAKTDGQTVKKSSASTNDSPSRPITAGPTPPAQPVGPRRSGPARRALITANESPQQVRMASQKPRLSMRPSGAMTSTHDVKGRQPPTLTPSNARRSRATGFDAAPGISSKAGT